MSANHFAWIRASLPVPTDWYGALHEDVVPFLRSADVIFLCDTWFYELRYAGGIVVDLHLYADAAAVHSVLLPLMRERFWRKPLTDVEGPDLLRGRHRYHVSRWAEASHVTNPVLGHYHESTQLLCARRHHRKPGYLACLSELRYALERLRTGTCDAGEAIRRGYQAWLTQQLGARYTLDRTDERRTQERELTTFLLSQTEAPTLQVPPEVPDTWIAATQAVADEGLAALCTALGGHIARYGLDPFDVGRLWAQLAEWVPATGDRATRRSATA